MWACKCAQSSSVAAQSQAAESRQRVLAMPYHSPCSIPACWGGAPPAPACTFAHAAQTDPGAEASGSGVTRTARSSPPPGCVTTKTADPGLEFGGAPAAATAAGDKGDPAQHACSEAAGRKLAEYLPYQLYGSLSAP